MANEKTCLKCNRLVGAEDKFCSYCGSSEFGEIQPQNAESQPQPQNFTPTYSGQVSYNSPANQTVQPLLNMKWFKFLINFALFFAAVVFVTFGFGYLTGYIYFAQTNGQVTAEAVYETFGGLRVVDIIYGVLMIAAGGFGIFTRFRLAQYKSDGPVCLYIYYGVNAVLTLLYNIAVCAVTGLNTFSADGTVSLITSVVIIVLNVSYFNKRKEMFVN